MDQMLIEQLREQLTSARFEISQLQAQLNGDTPSALYWLQRKTNAQRAALARLNRRVVNQRFVLSTLEKLGRGLTREEWQEHRSARPDAELDETLLTV